MSSSNSNNSKEVMKKLFKEHVTYSLPDYLQKDEYVTKEEAIQQSAETLEGDTMAAGNYVNKYSMRDGDGKVYEPTPKHMFKNRIAPAFASIERKFGGKNALDEDEIYELMKGFNGVIPQGSVLSALGNYFQVQSTSNCFFINEFHDDSYGNIMKTDQEIAQIQKRRGGVGTDLSHLRPSGTHVNNAARTSSGAAGFAHRFSNTTNEVAQCIQEDQRVLIQDRGLVKIKNVQPGDHVWTKKGWIPVLDNIENEKDVYEVTTNRGYSIQISKDHVVSTFDEDGVVTERPLRELSEEDAINLLFGTDQSREYVNLLEEHEYERSEYNNSNRLNENITLPNHLDERFAYVLGVMYGDGYVIEGNSGISVAFNASEIDQQNKYEELVSELFNVDCIRRITDDHCVRIRFYSQKVVCFLNANGILKQKANHLGFPSQLWQSPTSVQSAFIAGHFDADGSFRGIKTGYRASSIDKGFLNKVQTLLLSNGIVSKLHIEDRSHKENWNDLYCLTITGRKAQTRFLEYIGEHSVKVNGTDNEISKRDHVLSSYKAKDMNIISSRYSYVPDNTQYMSTQCVDRLREEVETIPNTLVQDSIESIEHVGTDRVHDLVLPEEHMFWAEGFYVHNSGRRGALMISIDCRHPDLEAFIDLKREEGNVTGANISVKFTDDFMEAVKNEDTYTLRFPVDAPVEDADVTKEINAADVFERFVDNNYGEDDVQGAEPGALWIDQIHGESIAANYPTYKEEGTNPCFTGDTLIATEDGAKSFEELAGTAQDVVVYCVNQMTGKIEERIGRDPRKTKENVEVVDVVLEDGTSFSCTPDHPIMKSDRNYEQAQYLSEGDTLYPFDVEVEYVDTETGRTEDVYNITVDDNHNYIVITDPGKNVLDSTSFTAKNCFSGDTLIATADGRGAVSICELSENDEDVDVYAANPETGEVEIKRGRNPRITGTNRQMVRITFGTGGHIDVTPDHKMLMKDGTEKKARDIEEGDSLAPFGRRKKDAFDNGSEYWRINTNFKDSKKRILEHRLVARHADETAWNELYDENKASGGIVVHHKNYDGLNNDPENLEIMTFKEHSKYHSDHDTQGTKNGRWCGITNQELREIGIDLAKDIGRRFSRREWQEYAENYNLPQVLNGEYRSTDQYSNVTEFGKWCAEQADVSQFNNLDARVVDTFFRMLRQGYTAEIREINDDRHEVYVEKTCENCESTFMKHHGEREVSYCSLSCAQQHRVKTGAMDKAYENTQKTYEQKAAQKREDQLEAFVDLATEMGRDPYQREWEKECEKRNIPTKYDFDNYTDLKEHAMAYNHRVRSVEYLDEKQTVYNITVDDHHTVGIVTENNEDAQTGIFTPQCGEIAIPDGDSCRLTAINLYGYVKNPFEEDAYFDFEQFHNDTRKAMRIMDDVVEAEIDHIKTIIAKVEQDEEHDFVKQIELNLWNRILRRAQEARRTGLGTTALGDTLAALGIRYGSTDSMFKADEIYRTLKLAAYRESVELAKERGPFPIWDPELEKDNPFLLRIKDEDPELWHDMMEHGRRNIQLLTNAPTGTISTLAQVSSGVENVFSPFYFRKRKLNHDEIGVEADHVDETGERWVEFPVFHHKFETYLEKQGVGNPKELSQDEIQEYYEDSPYYGATTSDVDWVNKVKLQGVIQKHLDHSISSCLVGDKNHMVQTNEGLRYIEDIVDSEEQGFHDIDSDLTVTNHENNSASVSQGYYNGKSKTIKLDFVNKRSIEGTPHHKMLTLQSDYSFEWKKLCNINEGDYIISKIGDGCFGDNQKTISSIIGEPFTHEVKPHAKTITIPSRVTKDLARFLGYVIADGTISKNSVRLSQLQNNVVEDFISLAKSIFDIDHVSVVDDKRSSKDLKEVSINSRILCAYMEYLGLSNGSTTHYVPEIIFQGAGRHMTSEFIKGLTLDGHVSDESVIPLTTSSKRLANEVSILLEQFGIKSSIQENPEGEMTSPTTGETYDTQAYYVVSVSLSRVHKFVNTIGFAEDRKVEECESKLKTYWKRYESGILPDYGLRKDVNETLYPTLKSKKNKERVYYSTRANRRGMNISKETLLFWHDLGYESIPEFVIDDSYDIDQVQSVSYSDELKDTYDISVPDGHSYVVNGLVSHNTVNCPEDITREKLHDVYIASHEAGCKGCTIYRAGSRGSVLSTESVKKDADEIEVRHNDAPKRPEILDCNIHRIRHRGDSWKVFVGFLKSDPYEVFAVNTEGSVRYVDESGNKLHTARIQKMGGGTYRLLAPESDKVIIDDITEHTPSDEARGATRLISLALRHGVHVQYITSQLEKAEGSIVSFYESILKALREYTDYDPAQQVQSLNPDCDGEECELVYQEGCVKCAVCGVSKCS